VMFGRWCLLQPWLQMPNISMRWLPLLSKCRNPVVLDSVLWRSSLNCHVLRKEKCNWASAASCCCRPRFSDNKGGIKPQFDPVIPPPRGTADSMIPPSWGAADEMIPLSEERPRHLSRGSIPRPLGRGCCAATWK
jgi:hypothetical protein